MDGNHRQQLKGQPKRWEIPVQWTVGVSPLGEGLTGRGEHPPSPVSISKHFGFFSNACHSGSHFLRHDSLWDIMPGHRFLPGEEGGPHPARAPRSSSAPAVLKLLPFRQLFPAPGGGGSAWR